MKHLSSFASAKLYFLSLLFLITASCSRSVQEPINSSNARSSQVARSRLNPAQVMCANSTDTLKNGRCYSKEGMRCEAAGDYWTSENICISFAQKKCEDHNGKWLEAKCLSPDRAACETGAINLKWDETSKSCEYKRIIDYCNDPQIPSDIAVTIQAIQALYAGQNCEQIDAKLKNVVDLHILSAKGAKITNLMPLSGYINLKNLSLREQNISDLNPLASLSNLENLDLSDNQIENLIPLAKLEKLTNLILDKNFIRDLEPLSELNRLKLLSLQYNEIASVEALDNADIKSNGAFSNLEILDLRGNCQLKDIRPLDSNHHLNSLDITGTNVSLDKIPKRFKAKNQNNGKSILTKDQNEDSTCETVN